MRLLLDTHILLWWLADDPSLPARARDSISDPGTEVLVSAATVWEIAIKRASGKLDAPDDLLEALEANAFDTLAITAAHALAAGELPAHHADPFDRMLIAQAQAETLTLVSVDARLGDYEVERLPAP
ncbi:MAG TPA: type II toxin-antitoxin system VapC family toxin [Acidimicrobiales bacterium]|nr:type II toxin-antitoxin system VapC family toxin [Acidimicrobiales bacterium]